MATTICGPMDNTELRQQLEHAQKRIRLLEKQLAAKSIFRDAVEDQHRAIVEHIPLPCIEFNLQSTLQHFNSLRSEGLTDIEGHLLSNADALAKVIRTASTNFINRAARNLFQVKTGDVFIKKFEKFLTPEATAHLCHILGQLWSGKLFDTIVSTIKSASGKTLHVMAFWAIWPRQQSTWQSVWIALLDITQQKKAEQALTSSENRYRSLFEGNPSPVCQIDPKTGRIIDANPAASQFYGYSRDDLVGMTVDKLEAPGGDQSNSWLSDAVRGSVRLEKKQRLAGGEIRDVELYAGPFWDGEQKTIHTTIHDITQRKTALRALREAEEKYRNIVEESVQGILITREDGSPISMNPAMARIMGYSTPAEALKAVTSLPEQVYINADQRKLILEALESKGHVHGVPINYRRSDGSEAWVSVTSRAVFDSQGHIETIQTIAEDITSRVAAEEALAQSEKRYRAIVDNSLAAIYIFQNDKMVFLNKAFLLMLGYEREEDGLGKPFWEFIHPLDRDWVKQRAQARARGEQVQSHYPFRCIKKDGTPIWVDMQAANITFHGQPAVLGNLIDITERKMLSDRLAQAQKMEAVGTLASGIAHDFNNILQAISGYVQMMMSDDANQPNQDRIKAIASAVDRAADLIQRMLAFSRDLAPQFTSVDINREVRQACKLLERTIPKWINIKTSLADGLPPVHGDPIGIEQMLMNLATNARDAMPDGGNITITTSAIDIDTFFCSTRPDLTPGPYVVLKVSDTGPGIDDSIIEQIFDPFFSTKEIGRGTGLGLSQVYGMVKNHNGLVECESALGKGTDFRVYLPCAGAAHECADTPDPPGEPTLGRGEAVLLVDDERAILDVNSQTLAEYGYQTHTACSGEQALEQLGNISGVDLVILDLGMPGMGGRKCLERIRREFPAIKIIVASGYADDDNRNWALAQGAEAFLAKPYKLAELLEKVKKALKGC